MSAAAGPSPRRRVVVTGVGIRSAIGNSLPEVVLSLREGRGGIAPIRGFDAAGLAVREAAEVEQAGMAEHFTPRELRKLDRATQIGVLAAREALASAGLADGGVEPERLGIAVGVSGAGQFQNAMVSLDRSIIRNRLAGLFFARNVPHYLTEVAAERLGIRGFHVTFGAASAGSAVAIGQAAALLRAGRADVALAGGAEVLPVINVLGMQTLGVCAETACSPFSGAPGITFGEGAAFVVLEELEHARRRGATVLAELLGFGVSADAYDVISNDPSGDGLFRSMRTALDDAGVEPGEIGWIRASGTGNANQDLSETLAIRRLYEGAAATPPASSLDSFFGHVNGVSPVLGFAGAVGARNGGFIPPTLNFTTPRPGCDLDYVPNRARPAEVRTFLSNSAAFGGVNAALVGGRFEEARRLPDAPLDGVGITGIGIVSPVGSGTAEFLAALREGRSGVGELDRFEVDGCACRRAALVRDFRPRRLVPTLELRRVDRIGQYAAVAAGLALRDAALEGAVPPERRGTVVGMAHGPVTSHEAFFDNLFAGPPTPALGKLMLEMGRFAVTSRVAHLHQLRGFSTTVAGGISCGLEALVHAREYLRQNDAVDALVVVAADEIGPLYHRLFDRVGVLSGDGFGPYDPGAHGMVLGEGAVALVVERLGSARRRGAPVLAELAGCGLASDARGFLRANPEGGALERAARQALEEAGIGPDRVDVLYGHGRGVPAYDAGEAAALERVMGGRAVPACCVMGNTGVAEAASGLFSVAAAALGMCHGEAYPVAGEAEPRGLDFVRDGVRRGSYRRTLVVGGTENGNGAGLVLARD